MGQKVNPFFIRRAVSNSEISIWSSRPKVFSHLISQELEIREFLVFLLQSRGILLRSCKVARSNNSISLYADLYFSFALMKQAKSKRAKDLFIVFRKKYVTLSRIKDFRTFLEGFQKKETAGHSTDNLFLDCGDENVASGSSVDYNKRLSFILLSKEKKKHTSKKKMSFICVLKRSFLSKYVRLGLPGLFKLFKLSRLKSRFQNFYYNNQRVGFDGLGNTSLLVLHKSLVKTLQNFLGVEKVTLTLSSMQLAFLPMLKLYYGFILKELTAFSRNKSISGYFYETVELCFFVLGTFCYGNAALLARFITYLVESNRKHILVVRFIKKVLNILFNKIPLSVLAVNGIKVLIKGRFNKRRRTKTIVIQEGQISLQTLDIPIDYHQTKAVTLYGTFGIKVWLSKKII